jgi:hypothetical protein
MHPNPSTPDLSALQALLAGMREHNDAWENDLADYRTADGQDIREEALPDYEDSKDTHGWRLVEILPEWIAVLTRSLPAPDAP